MILDDGDDDADAVNLAACDYYQGVGTCSFHCYDEPECMTGRPDGGWPPLNLHPAVEQGLRSRRYDQRIRKWLAWLPFDNRKAALVDLSGRRYPRPIEVVLAMNARPRH